MERFDGRSMDVTAENIDKMKELFPEVFMEGKIDFDKLLTVLGEDVSDDFEKYEFRWKGKMESLKLAGARSTGTLLPCEEESKCWDTTQNIYIEGDNLEVLKLLQKGYHGKIKMIYIDPPYNTGNDFIYKDSFSDNISNYKEMTEQTGKSNPETSGRYHTNWLNMIYPRLLVSKTLLRDDGVIFISIDDNEVHNLRKVCDEVFGEDNFRNQIIVRRGAKSVQAQFDTWDKLGQDMEYILFYTKTSNYRFPKQTKMLDDERQGTWNNHWRGTDRPTMRYSLFGITPNTGQWRWSKDRSIKAIDNYKNMLRELGETEDTITQEKIDLYIMNLADDIDLLRLSKNNKPEHYIASTDSTLLNSSWYDLLVGSSSEIINLFEDKIFDTAKLTNIITRMLKFCNEDSLILDFFSGSSTTAHAVMKLNAEDGGKRKFIMVQIPEKLDPKKYKIAIEAGYKNICEIGKERIRRAGDKIIEELKKDKPAWADDEAPSLDIGFKVFKLDSSNIKRWDSSPLQDDPNKVDTILNRLNSMVDTIRPDRTELDVVYEVMLKFGIDLNIPVTKLEFESRPAYAVGEEPLFLVCLEPDISVEMVETMADSGTGTIVFAEECFKSDTAITNAELILKDKGIDIRVI